jgi:predicted ATPase
VGLDVHRAARIAAAAHGGQVVASGATRLLAAARLPGGVSFRDLGFHRLKDIEAPEHIFQLAAAGLPERFPPLRSLGAATSFPAPATPLVGRDDELAALRATVASPGVRLVTLTGPGGVGKTRLALAAASSLHESFPDGGYFVALAPIRDAEVMWKAIAGGLDVSGDGPDAEVVTAFLRERRALLVLDNLEQLDGAALVVAALLAAARQLVVLATSRRPLHVQGEHELPVPPLAIPHSAGVSNVAASGAAMLFAQQAQLVRPGFAITEGNAADVAAICARLDGLPLAIELAASRAKLLAPKALLARLGQGLTLAAADAGRPQRQQTMRDTIAWSYELLSPALAAVFRRMSVFAGGCDLDALTAVSVTADGEAAGRDSLELAAELQDLSLITVTEGPDGEPRVGMLETIRGYALERLAETGELDRTRHKHAEHYAVFAERAQEQLTGPVQLATLDRLEAEHANLLAALSWSLETTADEPVGGERASSGLRLVQALAPFWYRHGHAIEGRRWLQQAMGLTAGDPGAPEARMAHWLGMLVFQQAELSNALELFERSLAIWRALGDREEQARELSCLGATHLHLGDLDTARSLLEDSVSISRQIGSEAGLGAALTNLGQVEIEAGNFENAATLLEEALALGLKGGDAMRVAITQQRLALNRLFAGRVQEAIELLSSTLGYTTSSGDTEFLIDALELSAAIAAERGEHRQAARLTGAAESVRHQAGMPASELDADTLEHFLAPARTATRPEDWNVELAAGRALTQEQAAALLRSALERA